jgi:hypothetical protein
MGRCEFRAAFGRLFLLRDFNSPCLGLAHLGHGAISELSPLCAAERTWAQPRQTAHEKASSALDGVQFGRATRDHKRAAKKEPSA